MAGGTGWFPQRGVHLVIGCCRATDSTSCPYALTTVVLRRSC
jgi:hypothetical protein